jgi:hypothetical protein
MRIKRQFESLRKLPIGWYCRRIFTWLQNVHKLTMSTSEIGPILLTMMSTSMTAGGPVEEAL